jgi:DNA-binding GntR family transcriptional regulator
MHRATLRAPGERGASTPPRSHHVNVVFKTKESQVADLLREQIMSGELKRGQKLKQAEIAESLHLSITPVREALKLLEAEGYVLGTSHRGAVVAPFQIDEVDELYELRLLFEPKLAREASRRMTPEGLAELVAINETMCDAFRKQDWPRMRSANYRFHFRLYEMADQVQTLHFVRVLWAKYPFDLLSVMPNRTADVVGEHGALLDALTERDARVVAKQLQAHIESGHRGFKKHYGTTAAPQKK